MTDQQNRATSTIRPFASIAEAEEREESEAISQDRPDASRTELDAGSMSPGVAAGAMATGGGMAGGLVVDAIDSPHDDPVEGRRDPDVPDVNKLTPKQ